MNSKTLYHASGYLAAGELHPAVRKLLVRTAAAIVVDSAEENNNLIGPAMGILAADECLQFLSQKGTKP